MRLHPSPPGVIASSHTSQPQRRTQSPGSNWHYAKLTIWQAQSQAFLDYDRAFRQQKVADPSLRWNTLNPSLLASTTLGSRPSNTQTFCTSCREVDHTSTQCALLFLEPPQLPVGPAGPQHGLSQTAQGSPQCVTVGTEGHVLMAFDVDTSMFAPTVLLLVTKHPSVHSLLGSRWERTTSVQESFSPSNTKHIGPNLLIIVAL